MWERTIQVTLAFSLVPLSLAEAVVLLEGTSQQEPWPCSGVAGRPVLAERWERCLFRDVCKCHPFIQIHICKGRTFLE